MDPREATRAAAQFQGLDPDLFERQINLESMSFNPDVIACRRDSGAGARGIAQLMPVHWSAVDPCNVEQALAYAAGLMKGHLNYWNGNWALALASYNAGRQATIDGLAGRKANWPFAETTKYVSLILQIPLEEARARLKGGGGGTVVDNSAAIRARVIELGKQEIGKRYAGPIVDEPDSYRWGNPGWDCSSFVSGMYDKATGGKVKLVPFTDTAAQQTEWVQNPQPGDIVFYHYQDEQGVYWPHMGIWLSPTEVLDARYGKGVGVHPHVTPVGPDAQGRYRTVKRPAGLDAIVITPTPGPVPVQPTDPKDAVIAELQRQLADKDRRLNEVVSLLGVARGDYATQIQVVVDALRKLTPSP